MTAGSPRDRIVPGAFAAGAFLLFLLPGLYGPYGPFIDELYYVSCAERLDWGYVDHPPLSPFLLRLSRALLGDGLFALRFPVAVAGGLLVLGVGVLARRLGAGRTGQAIACAAAVIAPGMQLAFGFYSMNAFEVLIWFACGFLLVEIARRGEERWWLPFGLVAGLGLLNKHTIVIFAGTLAVGLLATPARRHLARPWIWAGLAVAAVLLAPNVAWQVAHGWPSLEFYRNADVEKNVPTPPHVALLLQILFMNPGTAPVWIAGIVFLLGRRGPLDLRHLGVQSLVLLALVAIGQKSRPDRILGMYPLLFAAGGVAWERLLAGHGRRWRRVALPAWMAAGAIVLAPLGIPLLPPATLAKYVTALRLVPQMEQGEGKRTEVPQWFADRLGWEQLVQDVAAVRDRLDPGERERVVYFAPSYGQAGALEWLGRERGLTPVYCTHNTWFLWGPTRDPVDVAIVLGGDPQQLESLFEEVEPARLHQCEFCMPWRNHMPIWIVRRERSPIADHWPEWKHYE